MLNSVLGRSRSMAASSRTSCARTWLPSGRGWTVIPSAPAPSAMRAAWTTLGMPMLRVLRSSATLLRFTLRTVMRTNASQCEQIPEDLAAFQRLVIEPVIDERAHQRLRLLLGLRIGVVVARHLEESPARHARLRSRALDFDRPALGIVRVALRRVDRATARAVALERHGVPELLEQRSLERTQRRGRAAVRREASERFPVSGKQGVMGVFAGQETQQELVEIEPAHERFAVKQRLSADPLGACERPQFASAEPGQGKRLKGEQDPAPRRGRAACSPPHHRYPPECAGKRLQQQARLAIGVAMQDEGFAAFLSGALSHSPCVTAPLRSE